MSEIEIYEIDTGYFNVDVPKGNTIVKVVLLEDYNKKIAEAKREVFDKIDKLRFTDGSSTRIDCEDYLTLKDSELGGQPGR